MGWVGVDAPEIVILPDMGAGVATCPPIDSLPMWRLFYFWGLTKWNERLYNINMTYRYEDTDQWIVPLLPIQQSTKRYVTVEQCRVAWKLNSKGATQSRLKKLIELGKAELVQVGGLSHYHILETE